MWFGNGVGKLRSAGIAMQRLFFLLLLAPLATASAATIVVTSSADDTNAGDSRCTLREAIANVNASADTTAGDCAPGTSSVDVVEFALADGYFTIITLTSDKELAIREDIAIRGPTMTRLVIDGHGHSTRVFNVTRGTANIVNVTIRNGGDPDLSGGAGLNVSRDATAILEDCTLSENVASNALGGAIANYGVLALRDSVLQENTAFSGSALFNSGTAGLSSCAINHNTTRELIGSDGGAISNTGTVTLTDCMLSGNSTGGGGQGGAVYNEGTAVFSNCTLTGNFVSDDCGGGAIENAGVMMLTNCTLNANSVGDVYHGGAIENSGTVTLINCTVAGNSAGGSGGGISNSGTAALINTIMAYNTAADDHYNVVGQNCAGPISDLGQNISSDGTCFSLVDLFVDPYLAPLGYRGGRTQTMALCTGWRTPDVACTRRSPAIDSGSDAVIEPPFIVRTDQRHEQRKSGMHVDIGSYEIQRLDEPAVLPNACLGDCNGNDGVTVDEILVLLRIALVGSDTAMCATGDGNGDGVITVNEIIVAVSNVLRGGCTALGRNCSDDSDCFSGFCTDYVCCATETCPAGEVCYVKGAEGLCAPLKGEQWNASN
jgi:CSLREA domain-containing protein